MGACVVKFISPGNSSPTQELTQASEVTLAPEILHHVNIPTAFYTTTHFF